MVGGTIEEAVITVIMLENAAHGADDGRGGGRPRPELPRAEIEKLKTEISQPEQFVVNFNYLVRRVQRRER